MSTFVLIAVLAAAAMHAIWNALVKHGGDPTLRLAVVALTGSLIGLPLIPFVSLPASAAWPWLAASVAIHLAYYMALSLSYRLGDLSFAYPLARGMAPPLVAVGGVLVGDQLAPGEVAALGLISGGILLLALVGRGAEDGRRPIAAAAVCGAMIGAYTICDGIGVRAAGTTAGYIVWLFVIDGLVFGLGVLWRRRSRLGRELPPVLRPAMLGGVLSMAAYGIVIWAMSTAPLALVSALRETSVVLAAAIGTRLMGEGLAARRVTAAALVCLGIAALKLG